MLMKTAPQVLVSKNEVLATTSMNIAEVFGKLHKNILRDIEALKPNLPQRFWELNFELSNYETKSGKNTVTKNPMYLLTRDAFTLLVMGFTGKKALQFKVAYIAEFNRMQALLQERHAQQVQSLEHTTKEPELTFMDGQLFASSLNIAEVFSKTHSHVMRDIRLLERRLDKNFYTRTSKEKSAERCFFETHFLESSYPNALGVECPMYYLSRTGLTLLLMTYSSPRYFTLKCSFLEKFLAEETEEKTPQALPDKQTYFYVETLLEHLRKYKKSLLPRERPSRDYLDFVEHSLENILTS